MPSSLLRRLRAVAALAVVLPIAACAPPSDVEDDASDGDSAFTGTPNDDIGQFFMIEHFGVEPGGYADVHAMVRTKNLGALILWNPSNASGEVARQMATRYAATAHEAGHAELFVAADQEEKGTQRFRSRHGFTDLVDGATLGRIVARDGSPRVCELHARITAREMSAAGLNMTLGTVSDVYTRDSGTPGMFRSRAIGPDASVIASCIRAMTKAYGSEEHVVFITKHFPGLGNASGNTDVDPTVHTYSTTKEKMENELAPYRSATASVNGDGTFPLFGTMVSHASYTILDSSDAPATLSSTILEDLLRGSPTTELPLGGLDKDRREVTFKGMDLKGLTVSDAFWTWGATKNLQPIEKRRLMARSFLAGMDILMIAKAEFNGAWSYFQEVYAGQLPAAEQAALVSAAGERDWPTLLRKFKERVAVSAKRIKMAKSRVGDAATYVRDGEPRKASADLVDEYQRLTR
jgi:beta-glucosidase-like glycosyl hydrolase